LTDATADDVRVHVVDEAFIMAGGRTELSDKAQPML
jgi:hypothetical protein